MQSALFVSKSDSYERRSIKEDQPIFLKSRRPLLVHHLGTNTLVTDSMFERLSPANTTDALPLNFLNKNISVLTHK